MASTSKKLVTGAALRLVTFVANVLVGFFMMPFLVSSLGDEQYGLWILVGAVVGFYGLIDLGMGVAVNRFVIRAIHDKKGEAVNEALSTSMVLFTGFGILSFVITIIIFFAAPYFVESPEISTTFQIIFAIIGIKVSLLFPLSVFTSVLLAKYRFDLQSYIHLASLFIRTLCIIYFVSANYGLLSLALITSIDALLVSLVIIFFARRLVPNIKISIANFRLKKFKEYLHYGKYVYVLNISGNIRTSMPSLIIGAFVSVSAITHYAIAITLLTYAGEVIASIFGVVGPVLNKYHKLEEWDNLREAFLVVTELSAIVSVLIGGLLILLGDPFISIWMGNGYDDVYIVLVILTAGSIIGNIQIGSKIVLFAIAKHKYFALLNVTGTVIIFSLSLLLVQYYGIYGVAMGALIPPLIIQLFLIPIYACHNLNVSKKNYFVSLVKISSCGVVLLYCAYLIVDLTKVDTYIELIFISSIFSVIYLFIMAKFILSVRTRKRVNEMIPDKFRKITNIFL